LKETDALKIIELAIPATDRAAGAEVAKAILSKAILKVGRLPNVSFNRKWATFNFVSGKKTYIVGQDILGAYSDFQNASELWSTDNTQPIMLVSLEEFNAKTRGLSDSGRPEWATLHSSTPTLEVYPTPDSAYEYGLYAKLEINKFEGIPSAYHDVLIDTAVLMVKGLADPNVAAMLMQSGIKDAMEDSLLGWSGTTIRCDRVLGSAKTLGADSGNLRGD